MSQWYSGESIACVTTEGQRPLPLLSAASMRQRHPGGRCHPPAPSWRSLPSGGVAGCYCRLSVATCCWYHVVARECRLLA